MIAVDRRRFLGMIEQTPFFAIRIMRVPTRHLRHANKRMALVEGVASG